MIDVTGFCLDRILDSLFGWDLCIFDAGFVIKFIYQNHPEIHSGENHLHLHKTRIRIFPKCRYLRDLFIRILGERRIQTI